MNFPQHTGKHQSQKWVSLGKSAPKKVKEFLSAYNVMATERITNDEYYANLLDLFNDDLEKKGEFGHVERTLVRNDARVISA